MAKEMANVSDLMKDLKQRQIETEEDNGERERERERERDSPLSVFVGSVK